MQGFFQAYKENFSQGNVSTESLKYPQCLRKKKASDIVLSAYQSWYCSVFWRYLTGVGFSVLIWTDYLSYKGLTEQNSSFSWGDSKSAWPVLCRPLGPTWQGSTLQEQTTWKGFGDVFSATVKGAWWAGQVGHCLSFSAGGLHLAAGYPGEQDRRSHSSTEEWAGAGGNDCQATLKWIHLSSGLGKKGVPPAHTVNFQKHIKIIHIFYWDFKWKSEGRHFHAAFPYHSQQMCLSLAQEGQMGWHSNEGRGVGGCRTIQELPLSWQATAVKSRTLMEREWEDSHCFSAL